MPKLSIVTDFQSAPLCWGQWWGWREQQLPAEQRSPSVHLSQAIPVPDGAGVDVVREALRRVTARHSSLRSVFVQSDDGTPRQVVQPVAESAYELGELNGADEAAASAWLLGRDFDLGNQWPLRAAIVRTSSGATVLGLVVHHIAADRYALQGLGEQVRDTIEALVQGSAPPLPPPDRQPVEIAAFEQSTAGAAVNERTIAYWQRHDAELGELLAALRRGFHRPNRAMYVARAVSQSAARRLPGLATAAHGSQAAVMTAAVASALAAHLGRRTVPMFKIVPNRHRPGYARSVASLAQGGLVSVEVPDPRDLRAVVPAAWAGTVAAMRHGYYDGDELAQRMSVSGGYRDTVVPPSINVMRAEANSPPPEENWPTGDQPYTVQVKRVERPCLGLNFHIELDKSYVQIELRAGTHLLSEPESAALVANAMTSILKAE